MNARHCHHAGAGQRLCRRAARLLATLGLTAVAAAPALHADTSNLVIGARAQGLGAAFSAVSDDANATFWNPAGMTLLRSTEFTYSHWALSDVSDVGVDFAAVAVPFTAGALDAAVGLSFVRVGADLEEGASATQQDISDSRFSLSGGLRLARFLSVGISLNRLEVTSDRGSGAGFGFDAAAFVQPLAEYDLRLALVGKNLSGDVKNEALDQSWRIGAAGGFWKQRILVALDTQLRRDINGSDGVTGLVYAGVEVTPIEYFALRFGGGSEHQYGLGFGVRHRGFGLDYAFSGDDEVLGDSHRVSVSFAFGAGAFGRSAAASPSDAATTAGDD